MPRQYIRKPKAPKVPKVPKPRPPKPIRPKKVKKPRKPRPPKRPFLVTKVLKQRKRSRSSIKASVPQGSYGTGRLYLPEGALGFYTFKRSWTGSSQFPAGSNNTTTVDNLGAHNYSWREKAGSKTLDYRRRIALKQRLPDLPYTAHSETSPMGEFSIASSASYNNNVEGDVIEDLSIHGQIPRTSLAVFGTQTAIEVESEVYDKLLAKLLKKVGQEPISGGVILAESHKTAQSITSVATRLTSSFKALRSGNLTAAFSHLGASVSSTGKVRTRRFHDDFAIDAASTVKGMWLEMRYAWRPLLKDVEDVAHKMAEMHLRASGDSASKGSDVVQVRASAASKKTRLFPGQISPYGFTLEGKSWESYSATGNGRVQYAVTNPAARTLQQCGFNSLATVAWELIPYSFCVDWLIPIGAYLELRGSQDGLTFMSGYLSIKVHGELGTVYTPPSGAGYSGGGHAGLARGDKFTRHPVGAGGLPVPIPGFRNPTGAKENVDRVAKCIDALALLSRTIKF